ncbi:MAG: periplasmic copper-binding protein [Candidatus Woesebacteria bacterium GW2011_GWA1_37_7]|uniref:Periplasmic copper-binding protein n=1 Tax=Candidatus Woesebacteria bacterium GW2011_GWA1_37_7 TaxID=1618545 RepID=A0A0G0H319_9BACT|nr:MAG: periplasmic copper-binding protein [Candidatus Woesebacteria bacterium GW2011_GWA1_37_7]
MQARKIIVALVIILVAIGGFVAGLVLLRQKQDVQEQAAVPGGRAEAKIQPESGNFNVGDTINTSIYFNTSNIAISGIAIRLSYPYSGDTSEVRVESIEVDQGLLSGGDWTCPVQTSEQQGLNVVVDIACANTSASGFTSNTDILLANVALKVERAPSVSPLVVRFDPAKSVIKRKSNNEDILLIPSSTGSYTIGGAGSATKTPTPTRRPGTSPTLTPTRTATVTVTPTSVATVSATKTPTPTSATLPEAGVSYPTLVGAGFGILVIVGAILLAI